ncbi:MAG: Hint domain-containing protein [Rubellimicrobium sp.]|nr:Hint domain-containing protein [Rubellimicrobium sp.]
MVNTTSWAWYPGAIWPGFLATSDNNISAGQNGIQISPGSHAGIVWHDANGDGRMADADTDDASYAGGESVTVGGATRIIKEIGCYTQSTFTVNGVVHHVPTVVWLFKDGTYMVRLNDADIPPGVHYSAVGSITLNGWNGTDYSHSYVNTRDDPFICFAAGTLIDTATGPRRVEDLRPGDHVLTLDRGMQPLRWTGRRTVSGRGRAAPVTIATGALGNLRPLVVSQQHRMLIAGWRAELLVGEAEVLVAALHLVNDSTIRLTPRDRVTWVHILFDRHEIVMAEGCPSESFHPGAIGLSRLDEAARDEILTLFPELAQPDGPARATARPCLRAHEARLVAGPPPCVQCTASGTLSC